MALPYMKSKIDMAKIQNPHTRHASDQFRKLRGNKSLIGASKDLATVTIYDGKKRR
jgi:hypothetical protein